MQEPNIFNLIKNASAEIAVAAALSCVITLWYTNSHKLSSKKIFVLSFIIGTVCCFLLSLFIKGFAFSASTVKNAVSGGTLSVTVTAFIKRFTLFDGDDIKTSLQELLSSIILSDKLDEVVEEIILKIQAESEEITETELKAILKQNTTLEGEDKLDAVCKLILEALKKHDTTE